MGYIKDIAFILALYYFYKILAGIAQLVEQLIRNQQVVGSSPTAGSSFLILLHFLIHFIALANGEIPI